MTYLKILFLALVLCGSAHAQSTFGAILGSLTDSSGRAVAKAKVRLSNTLQNVERETQSGEDGAYSFLNLNPGSYRVSVTAPGFQTTSAEKLVLEARQTLRVDLALQVGDLTQVVQVNEEAGLIATDSPAIASSLRPEKVANLPANFRASTNTSPYALLQTLPGVQPDNGGGYGIQGGIPAQTESSSDGISITNMTGNGPQRNFFPSIESISEIRVQGVGNQAEYGAPGDITIISKGGSNQYHGALFWYHQNRAFDALSFGQRALPAKVSNNFGGTVSGPVSIPKFYNGKDKTFFLFTWESLRFPRQSTIQNTVPTARMKAGDFSQEVTASTQLLDPATRTPFPGNILPSNLINPVARAIIPFYPNPNAGSADRVSNANFVDNRLANIESDQYDVRVDQTFNEKHSAFGRYTSKKNPTQSPNNLLLPGDVSNANQQQLVGAHTWSIRPNLLNELRGGYAYSPSFSEFLFDGRAFTDSLNLRDIQRNIFFNGLPNFAIDRVTSFNKGRPGRGASTNIQFIDNLTWLKGKHTFKFGGDFRRLRAESTLGFTTGNNYGDFSFTGNFTNQPFADFLLGIPAGSAIAVLSTDNDGRANHAKFYAQDSWRITPKLTLDYGLRWEFHPGYSDAGFNIANFDRTAARTGRVVIMNDPVAKTLVAPGAIISFNGCFTGQSVAPINGIACTPIVTASEAGLPEGLRKNYYSQFLPRVGLAYRLNDKTTIRTSAGLYNMIILGNVFFSLTGTVQSDVRQFNNISSAGQPIFRLPETRTPGSNIRSQAVGTFEFRTANQIDFRPPQMTQWMFSVDRQIGSSLGLRVSYIGNKGTHMPWAPDLNQMLPATRFFSQRSNLERPFPNWGLVFSRDAGGNTNYNALQLELNRRLSKGLSFTFGYTLAKGLGDNAGPAPGGYSGENGGGRNTDSYNRAADYGNQYAIRRHRSVSNLVYELPFGRGRAMMSNASRAVDAVLGGWQLSSILTIQSGPWMTPTFSGGDPSGSGAPTRGTQRPDRIGDGSVSDPTPGRWLDRTAFLCPGRVAGAADQFNCSVGSVPGRDLAPIGRFGNAGIGFLQGPGTIGWNMGASKRFRLTERVSFRLEGSFTNLPNINNYADPELNITNANFGRITSSRGIDFGGGRTGQVGARIEF